MIEKYRCLSLWEPWASLIAMGKKTIETRSYSTKVRGDVLICAAKVHNKEIKGYIKEYIDAGILPEGFVPQCGNAVALVELDECRPFEYHHNKAAANIVHDYHPGTYSWTLRNVRPLIIPVSVKGSQGFFFKELDLEESLFDEEDYRWERKVQAIQFLDDVKSINAISRLVGASFYTFKGEWTGIPAVLVGEQKHTHVLQKYEYVIKEESGLIYVESSDSFESRHEKYK